MSAPDRIPWTKINRLYIGFATVKDGILTELPTGSSPADVSRRDEMRMRIREVVKECRENNPDTEIFIVSNFGERELAPEYLQTAQDPQKFADSVLAYLKENDLDGYDMDWESHSIDDYAPQLTSLLDACHATSADSYAKAGFPYGKMIGGVESGSGYPESGGPDTKESVAAKCAYIRANNMAGLFEWRLDNDMRPDGGAPTYQVTGWMSNCMAG